MAHVAPLPGPKPAVPVPDDLRQQVATALMEDIRGGDLTAALIPPEKNGRATVITREAAILCGIPYVEATFRHLDSRVSFDWLVLEGEAVSANQVLFSIEGPARALLTGERTALNFLQLLSGTATATHAFAQLLAGTRCRLLDTRKTIPGLRTAQKYAVRVGGGHNHRMGLFDGILIKENDIALLDNFSLEAMRDGVALNAQATRPLKLEASGGITTDTIRAIAETGVDFISVGSITKHVQAVDLSMRFEWHA